jgi:hypothetical protein
LHSTHTAHGQNNLGCFGFELWGKEKEKEYWIFYW